jgi:REP element-mobilizing transposase RayT
VDGEMVLNDIGRIVVDEWEKTAKIRSNVELDVFTVMPNHFRAIFLIHDSVVAYVDGAHISAPLRRQSGSIGSVFAGFKSATTKQINVLCNNHRCPVWQRNYYERIIRNEDELSRAREYIVNNPMKWELDKENPINCRDDMK